jgi:hypothetical protein
MLLPINALLERLSEMTDQEKLVEIKKRISDLGTMVYDKDDVVAALNSPRNQEVVSVLWNRLWAIREIILTPTPTKPYVPQWSPE